MTRRKGRTIVVIAHNMRSCHNVGSILRTADGLGISKVWLTGYTPYPQHTHDNRLPHIVSKLHAQIQKTALGAEQTVAWEHSDTIEPILRKLKSNDHQVIALEQTKHAVILPDFVPSKKIAIILGREVEGLEKEVLEQCDAVVEIPMLGAKESFNVAQAAAMALYHCRFASLTTD